MKDFERQKGIAFLLLYCSGRDLFYYLKLSELLRFQERADQGGLKRFRLEELDMEYALKQNRGLFVPYLEGLQKDLLSRD